MSEGLKHKYNITKSNGNPVDAKGVYFVLKLNSKDEAHKNASLQAARRYADLIEESLPELGQDLRHLCRSIERPSMQNSEET